MKKLLALGTVVLFIFACSSSDDTTIDPDPGPDPDPASFDRGVMLANWADNIIIPSYEAFSASLNDLESAFADFNTTTDQTNLDALRAAWLDAYKAWQYVSMFENGPAETILLRSQINTYPTDVLLISSHIANGGYDFALPANRDSKGFPALDYLLFGLADNDADILSAFDADHLTYVQDIIDDMQANTDQVLSDWNSTYRDTFVANDGSSATASTDRMVNDFIFYYEKFLRAGKMGIPLGVFSGTQAPTTVEAYHNAEVSNELFLEGLQAVQDFFNGKHFASADTGESLSSYLITLDQPSLSQQINVQFNSARNGVSGLFPFRMELENNDPAIAMLAAYDEVQKAVPVLKVDMLSALSISVDFVDADGD